MGAVGTSQPVKNTNTEVINNNAKQSTQTSNLGNKAQKLVDYFNERTIGKLDISPYLEPKYDSKGYTTVDYERMPRVVQQSFNQVVQEGKIESTDYGAWGKWIKLKK